MNKRTLTITVIVAAVMLVAVPFVYAQHARHGRMHGDGFGGGMLFGHLLRAKEALNLSDAQVDQLKQIATELRTQNAPYREQLRGDVGDVAQLLLKDPNDLAGAQAVLDKHIAAERTMKANALVAASKALNVLTPDQRAKVQQFLAARQNRRNASHDENR